jgi:hypothetical protein
MNPCMENLKEKWLKDSSDNGFPSDSDVDYQN